MVLIADGGGGGPTLNPKAKHYERELFKVFAVETGSIAITQTDWQGAKTQLEDLAKDVRAVRSELEAPTDGGKGWTGPAATAALSTLKKLSDTLDAHAGEVGDVDTSLGQVYKAVTDAEAAWYSDVSSISTYVDPANHMRLPAPYAPTAENVDKYSVPDPDAAAAAEDAKWQQRNLAAKKILEQLATDTETAKATMPIDVKDDAEDPYSNQGPSTTNRTPGSATQSGGSGYPTGATAHPVTQVGIGGPVGNIPDDTGLIPVVPTPEPETIVVTEGPDFTPNTYEPISSDGDVTGTTGYPSSTGPGDSQGSYPTGGNGGSGVGAGGVAAGGAGGAAGLGGLLRARGGGGMFSTGGSARAGGSTARGSAGGSRGAAFRTGGGARGTSMVPGGGAAAGRGGAAGASARGSAVKGSTVSGKYGVPKVAGKGGGVVSAGGAQGAKAGGRGSGGKGAAGKGAAATGRGGSARGGAATGAAGRGGARKGDKKGTPEDIARLTLEDEETWYEGTEESSPQVWE